jgi:hypothetical protein
LAKDSIPPFGLGFPFQKVIKSFPMNTQNDMTQIRKTMTKCLIFKAFEMNSKDK